MKKLIISFLLLLITAFAFAQNNVTVNQTAPFYYHPSQTTYPGSADSLVAGWNFYFNGIENYQYAQVWQEDVTLGWRQKTLIGEFIDDGFFLSNIYPTSGGKLALLFYDNYTHIVNGQAVAPFPNFLACSNVFTYQEGDLPIVGGSSNLGTAPCPPNCPAILTGAAVAKNEVLNPAKLSKPGAAKIRKGHVAKPHGKK